ncbi:MAG: hypothetical protein EBU08_03610 [Micrococcales bacterium]|nr:hypothetical protein [Micrococcales bacterium]NBS85448.1 hypothetical protein [Micrococcales bacterium]
MDKKDLYVQPHISVRLAQYIQKALDYLHIYAQKMDEPEVIEPELHAEADDAMTDIMLDAPLPEEESNG